MWTLRFKTGRRHSVHLGVIPINIYVLMAGHDIGQGGGCGAGRERKACYLMKYSSPGGESRMQEANSSLLGAHVCRLV